MKKSMLRLSLGLALLSWIPSARAFQLQDCMSTNANPKDVWRVMRPQDFVGAPTLWQILV